METISGLPALFGIIIAVLAIFAALVLPMRTEIAGLKADAIKTDERGQKALDAAAESIRDTLAKAEQGVKDGTASAAASIMREVGLVEGKLLIRIENTEKLIAKLDADALRLTQITNDAVVAKGILTASLEAMERRLDHLEVVHDGIHSRTGE